MVEGKLKIWIRGGKFEFRNDLYIKVLADTREMWKTDESDSYKPKWDSTCVKHVKGDYEKLTFHLMDEDTFSKDDLLGSCELPFKVLEEGNAYVGEMEMKGADGKVIGTLDLNIEYEAGDVSAFDLMNSRIHTEDD